MGGPGSLFEAMLQLFSQHGGTTRIHSVHLRRFLVLVGVKHHVRLFEFFRTSLDIYHRGISYVQYLRYVCGC